MADSPCHKEGRQNPEKQMPKQEDNNMLLQVFSRMSRTLHRAAAVITGNDDEADDILQDAFVRLWTKHGELDSSDEAAAMMSVTVRNLSIDSFRRQQRHPEMCLDEYGAAHAGGAFFPGGGADDGKREAEEQFDEVMALIRSKLTPRQQEIMLLRDYEGCDYASIARKLQMQETAVRMQLSRARKIVREAYRETSGTAKGG